MEGDWEEEETCPKTSPLTLTGVIKGPKNRGKVKETEAEREGNSRASTEAEKFEPHFDSIPLFKTNPSRAS